MPVAFNVMYITDVYSSRHSRAFLALGHRVPLALGNDLDASAPYNFLSSTTYVDSYVNRLVNKQFHLEYPHNGR